MSRVLTVCFLVVANLAIPATSFAVTITIDFFNLYWARSQPPADMSDTPQIRFRVGGAGYVYEPSGVCSVGELAIGCADMEFDVGALDGLITTETTVTVTAAAPVEGDGEGESSGNCDLSTDEALEIWLSYFFVSWGIMIPVFIAALSVGAIAKVIRGNR